MKLIIQIPCLNEEETLPLTVAEIQREISGVDCVELLVIDDGSTDRTVQVARDLGVDHIVSHRGNRGLAVAFQTGLDACLRAGADIIVNTDADNQYPGRYIPELIDPILNGEADMVVADRQVQKVSHFSPVKRFLQGIGSAAVRFVSGTEVPDAPSGFRAISREAAMRLNVVTRYTYTIETVVQAGNRNMRVAYIPIITNPHTRESRLFNSMWTYVSRSAVTILRLFALYEPLKVFTWLSVPFFLVGMALFLRFFWFFISTRGGLGDRLIQSVIVGAASLIIGFLVFLFGILADLVATNRRLHEDALYYLKRLNFDKDSTETNFGLHDDGRKFDSETPDTGN